MIFGFHFLGSILFAFVVGLLVRFAADLDFLFRAGEDTAKCQAIQHAVFRAGGQFTFARDNLRLALGVLTDLETFFTQVAQQDALDLVKHLRICPQFFGEIDLQIGIQNRFALKGWPWANADEPQVIQCCDHRVDVAGLQFFGGLVERRQFPGVAKFVACQFDGVVPFVLIFGVDLRPAGAEAGDVRTARLEQIGFGPVGKFGGDIESRGDLIDFVFAELAEVALVFAAFDFVPDDEVRQGEFAF